MNTPNPKIIATTIVQRLFEEGYTAYFAGGWVRDLLLGIHSHEIDIATSAPPHKVSALFPKTVPVGIHFGVVLVIEEGCHFEVTTFRKDHAYHDGRHPDGVDFSTPEKDAERRDFTINGMFYDPLTETLHDFVGGQEDLKRKVIRAIGVPDNRFTEDRLRMIRAIRFAARFGFSIEQKTHDAILAHANTLFPAVSIERVWQEFTKMSHSPRFSDALCMMHQLQLLPTIFPSLQKTSLEEIQKRVAPFHTYPSDCPTIVYLLALFPYATAEELDTLCHFLKISTHDRKIALFFAHAKELFKTSPDKATWAHFYAHPHSSLFLSTLPSSSIAPHLAAQEALAPHIERIRTHHPLISAAHLMALGIPPGKRLGLLLKEAEKIVINENLSSPSEALTRLRYSPYWTPNNQ